MKKIGKLIVILLFIVIIGLVAAAGYIAVAARDDTDVETAAAKSDARSSGQILNAALSSAFVETASSDEISVKLDQNGFDALLCALRREVNNSILRGMASEITDSDTVILKLGLGTSYKTVL